MHFTVVIWFPFMNSRPRLHHMYDHTLFCISIHFHDCDIDQIICKEWLQMAEFLKRFIQGKLQTWAASEFREFSVWFLCLDWCVTSTNYIWTFCFILSAVAATVCIVIAIRLSNSNNNSSVSECRDTEALLSANFCAKPLLMFAYFHLMSWFCVLTNAKECCE